MAGHAERRAGLSAAIEPAPDVTAAELRSTIDRLSKARRRLAGRPVESILAALANVAECWLAHDSVWRQRAEVLLPSATGFSPEMVRHALPFLIEPLRAPALAELLDAELGDRRRLDARRTRSPDVILHVLSGNLPALAAFPMAASLAVKSAALVKAASGDRIFPVLWAKSISEVDADLGACLAPVYWRGGERDCEREAFGRVDLVVAFGSDAAIDDLRARSRGRFIGHGHKMSFAVVSRDVLRDAGAAIRAASQVAYDVSIWDQKGCLSPQMCYVEGDFESAVAFAEMLVSPLRELAQRLPPGDATMEEQLAVRRFRQDAVWNGIASAKSVVLGSEGSLDWTVVVDRDATLRPTPLHRSLRVVPFAGDDSLVSALAPSRRFLEAAGIAATEERAGELGALLTRSGVSRVCGVGEMQRPPLSWRQGGRPRVGDWLKWSDDDV
jgi:hypothetical protein